MRRLIAPVLLVLIVTGCHEPAAVVANDVNALLTDADRACVVDQALDGVQPAAISVSCHLADTLIPAIQVLVSDVGRVLSAQRRRAAAAGSAAPSSAAPAIQPLTGRKP